MSRKGPKRTYRCSSYTAEAMLLAYLSVRSGQYTGRKAAAKFNVPYGTLNKKLSGRAPVEAHGAGRPIEISTAYEQKFAEYLSVAGKYGYGYSRCEIKDLVSEFVKKESIKTRWLDGKPGNEWLKNFLRRHPEINARKDDSQLKRLDGVDPFVVYQFYDDLRALCESENISNSDGERVYNVCETLFRNNLGGSYAFPTRCAKCISKTAVSESELDTSVVVSVRADGEKLHPLIVFQGRCVLPSCIVNKKAPETTSYVASSRKWLEDTMFSYWFENVFIPQIPSSVARCGKSVVLLFDGSSMRVNIRCLSEALKHNVILVKLPPKLSKHLQPLSRTCLSSLKSSWDEQLVTWKGENVATIQKLFSQFLGIVWSRHFGKRIVKRAFETTGIFPHNKDRFPVKVLSQSALKRYLGRNQVVMRRRRVKEEVESGSASANPDPIYEIPSPPRVAKPNMFQSFAFKKRSSSSTSGPLDLSKRRKSTESGEEKTITEINKQISETE